MGVKTCALVFATEHKKDNQLEFPSFELGNRANMVQII